MSPSGVPHQRHVRYSGRHQARLDAETHAKLEEFARTFPSKRSAILRYVMQWGLTQTGGWTVNMAVPSTVHTVGILLEPELLQQVQDAAAIHGVSMAAWLREAMRRVTPEDFQESWRARETATRSHESGNYNRKFGMRLNEVTWRTLEGFTTTFQRPAAEIIRRSSRRCARRIFRRAGSWRSRNAMRHTLAAMAWAHERRPRHDMAVGIILVQRLVLRSRPPEAGLLDRHSVPLVDVRTCLERHSR